MKTDLAKIISVSGKHGLFRYVAPTRGGAIAEALCDNKRTAFGGSSRMTTLADIAIYTSEGEMKLSEVFKALEKSLAGAEMPSSKASDAEVRAIFDKAVPDYDADRFHISHMRKIMDWYSELLKFASLEFEKEEQESGNA